MSKETVSVRIRLPKQCLLKFTHKNNIGDIKNWVNHELVNHENAELINEFELVSTMPRKVYKNNTQTMKQIGFWRESAKRECRTPLLYVKEHAIVHGIAGWGNTPSRLTDEIDSRVITSEQRVIFFLQITVYNNIGQTYPIDERKVSDTAEDVEW